MIENQADILNELGVIQWQRRELVIEDTFDEEVLVAKAPIATNLSWPELQECVKVCTHCNLHQTRTNTVFGAGNPNADLVIVGEAPGANEDCEGKPFVGKAGELLDRMLEAIGFAREDVFLCNVLKCRPPNNRDPSAEEVKICTTYLDQQLAHLQPRCILAVGRVAAHYMLGIEQRLGDMRTQAWTYGDTDIPLYITYHPTYLLRNPRDKGKAYQDLSKVAEFINRQ